MEETKLDDITAYEILGLSSPYTSYSTDDIKRAYRMKILQYHPDKNKGAADASDKFIQVQNAYRHLMDDIQLEDEDSTWEPDYNHFLRLFLSSILEEEYAEFATPIIAQVCSFILEKASSARFVVPFLKKINRKTLKVIYKILVKYGVILHIRADFVQAVEEILREPYADEYIVLNPRIDDLLSENVYKLKYQESTYYVPLWHHDMVYDHGGRDLIVKCYPILPDNMEIDESNRLIVHLEYSVSQLWLNPKKTVKICDGFNVQFEPSALRLTDSPQKIVLRSCGIPVNNVCCMMNSNIKQDIVLSIRITGCA